jgi:hypothetical protein
MLMNLPMHVVCWNPFIDASATLYFMKAYRSRLESAIRNSKRQSTIVITIETVQGRSDRQLTPASSTIRNQRRSVSVLMNQELLQRRANQKPLTMPSRRQEIRF